MYHLLSKKWRVVLAKLHVSQNRLNAHINWRFKLKPIPAWSCGQDDKTAHTHMHTRSHTHTHTHLHTHTQLHTQPYKQKHTHNHTYTNSHTHSHKHTHTNKHMCTHTHTHTERKREKVMTDLDEAVKHHVKKVSNLANVAPDLCLNGWVHLKHTPKPAVSAYRHPQHEHMSSGQHLNQLPMFKAMVSTETSWQCLKQWSAQKPADNV